MDNGNQVSTLALFAIAAAGGLGVIVSGLVTAWVNVRNEKRQADREHLNWLKEKKYTEYAKLVSALRHVLSAMGAKGPDGERANFRDESWVALFDYVASSQVVFLLLESESDRFSELITSLGDITARQSYPSSDDEKSEAHELLVQIRDLLRADLAATSAGAPTR